MLARRSHFSVHFWTRWPQDGEQEGQDGDQEAQDGRRDAKIGLQMRREFPLLRVAGGWVP